MSKYHEQIKNNKRALKYLFQKDHGLQGGGAPPPPPPAGGPPPLTVPVNPLSALRQRIAGRNGTPSSAANHRTSAANIAEEAARIVNARRNREAAAAENPAAS